jgi:hypothetical protein
MANPDHLEMLRQGVDAWNVWREQQPVEPDLSEADHREMDFFGGADLTDANLSEAYFNWQGHTARPCIRPPARRRPGRKLNFRSNGSPVWGISGHPSLAPFSTARRP